MFFHQRFVPGLAIYSYIVGDEKTKREGYQDVATVLGGMSAWKAAGLPYENSSAAASRPARDRATAAVSH